MSDHETTLRAIAQHGTTGTIYEPSPEERAACLAGADALRRGTCGTCSEWMTNHGSGWDSRHPCHFYSGVFRTADDGCIKGWTPKTETTPIPEPNLMKAFSHLLAPPAVAGGDAPEIQVGDWVMFLDDFLGPWLVCGLGYDVVWLKGTGSVHKERITEIRYERNGQPFIWRRRQEGQP